jgi:hypothetical protein
MSSKNRNPNHKDVSDNHPRVSRHAELRYLQRVDASATHPAADLRRMFSTGQVTASPQVDHGQAIRHGNYLIVYHDGRRKTIVTVLRSGTGS